MLAILMNHSRGDIWSVNSSSKLFRMNFVVSILLVSVMAVYAVNGQSIFDLFNIFGGRSQNQVSRSYQPQINRQQYNPVIHGPMNQQRQVGNQNYQPQSRSNGFDGRSQNISPIEWGSSNSIRNPSANSRNNVIGNNAYNNYNNPNSLIQNSP